MKLRHRTAALVLLAIAATPASVQTSIAQMVCANCSTELTQLLNYAQLIDQLAKQASILETNLNQYKNMTTNTTPLTSFQWGNASNDLQAVNALLGNATSLSYATGNLDSQFGQKYSDYNGYVAANPTPATFASKYQQWSTDTNSNVLSSLKAAGLQSSQIRGDEEATLQTLQSQAANVQGNLDALQTLSGIGIQNIRQIQKLRQLVMTDLSLKSNLVQKSQDEETQRQAAWRNFVKTPNVPTTGGARF